MSRPRFFAFSEKGLRDNNEDCLCAERIGDYDVLAVSDGVGGHECGEVASGIAIGCLKNAVRFYEGDIRTLLRNAVFDAHEQILAVSEKPQKKQGMATTLIAACVDDNLNCTIVNIGDSRAHIISANDVKTTKDHSLVNHLLDTGEISPDEAWQHPMSMVLTQALGDPDGAIEPDFYEVNLLDTFLLLSSDGLHDFLPKERIRKIILANGKNVKRSVRDLVQEALSAGSDDNITVVLAYGGTEPVPANGT
jgi:PPM family protein phosphatase